MLDFDQKFSLFTNSFIRFCEKDREKYEDIALKRARPEIDEAYEKMINFLEFGALGVDIGALASGIPIPIGSIIALPIKTVVNYAGKAVAQNAADINSQIMSFDQDNDYIIRLVLHEAIREVAIAFEYHLAHLKDKKDVMLFASTAAKRLMNFLKQQKKDFVLDVEGVIEGILTGSTTGERISSDFDDKLHEKAWTPTQYLNMHKWDSDSIFSKAGVLKSDGNYYSKNHLSKTEKYGYRKALLSKIDDSYSIQETPQKIYEGYLPYFIDVSYDDLVEYAVKHRDANSKEATGSFNKYIAEQKKIKHSIIAKCKNGPKADESKERLDLSYADLSKSDFTNINFEMSGEYKVDLSHSKLDDAIFTKANLRTVNMEDSSGRNAYFARADFEHAKLAKADFTFADLTCAVLNNAVTIESCNLSNAKVGGAIYENTNLELAVTDANIGATVIKNKERIAALENNQKLLEQRTADLVGRVQLLEEGGNMINTNLFNLGSLVPDYYPGDSFLHLEQSLIQNTKILLVGIAGSGKTQLARYFAKKHSGQYPDSVVFEFAANSVSKLEQSYHDAATQIFGKFSDKKSVNEIMSSLSKVLKEKTNCLFIFDNVDNDEVKTRVNEDILKILQGIGKEKQHQIIVTSQDSQITMSGGFSTVRINGWTESEAVLFLMDKAISNPADAIKLAREFEFLPLGIDSARRYITDTGIDVHEYLRRIADNELQGMVESEEDLLLASYYDKPKGQRTQNAAIRLAIEEVAQKNQDALELLDFCSFLSADKIPFALLVDCKSKMLGENPTKTIMEIEKDIKELKKYSLVTALNGHGDSRMIDLHRIVQKVTVTSMKEEEKQKIIAILLDKLTKYFVKDTRFRSEEANLFDKKFFEKGQIQSSFDLNKLLLPHVENFLDTFDHKNIVLPSGSSSHLNQIKLFNVLGYFYTQIGGGHLQDSEKYLLRAKEALERLINLHDTEVRAVDQIYHNFKVFAKNNEAILADFYPKLEGDSKDLIQDALFKEYYLSELYVSILYSLGRTYVYDKETYKSRREEFKSYIELAHDLANTIEQKTKDKSGTGMKILHQYLTKSEGLLYFDKENENNPKLIKTTSARYIELSNDPHNYYEDGKLKKEGSSAYDKIRCYKQVISCSNILKDRDTAREYLRKLDEQLEIQRKQGKQSERIADIYNQRGNYFLSSEDEDSLEVAKESFLIAYKKERPKIEESGKIDYPLFDACIGLGKIGLKQSNLEDAQQYFNEAKEIADILYPNGHAKLNELQHDISSVLAGANQEKIKAEEEISTRLYKLNIENTKEESRKHGTNNDHIVKFVSSSKYHNLLLNYNQLDSIFKAAQSYGGIGAVNQIIDLGNNQHSYQKFLGNIKQEGVEAAVIKVLSKTDVGFLNAISNKEVETAILLTNSINNQFADQAEFSPNSDLPQDNFADKSQTSTESNYKNLLDVQALTVTSFAAKEMIESAAMLKYFSYEVLGMQYVIPKKIQEIELPEFTKQNYFWIAMHCVAGTIGAFTLSTNKLSLITKIVAPITSTSIYGAKLAIYDALTEQKQIAMQSGEDKPIDNPSEFLEKCGLDIAAYSALSLISSGTNKVMIGMPLSIAAYDILISATLGGIQCYSAYQQINYQEHQTSKTILENILPSIVNTMVLYITTKSMHFDFSRVFTSMLSIKQGLAAVSAAVITDQMTKLVLSTNRETLNDLGSGNYIEPSINYISENIKNIFNGAYTYYAGELGDNSEL